VIGRSADIITPRIEKLEQAAFRMDEKLWPRESKNIQGFLRGKRFLDDYVPSQDIAGRDALVVDYGFGLGGYQGFLMHLQAMDAGLMPRRVAMEAMPGGSDVDEWMRLIELEQMDAAGQALFQQLAGTGQLDMVVWMKLRKAMAEKGWELAKVIEEYQEEIQQAAQAATAAPDADISALTAPESEVPEPDLRGIPPELFMGV
jgi:hypothetical protein